LQPSPAGTWSGVRPRFFQPSIKWRARARATFLVDVLGQELLEQPDWSSTSRMVKSDFSSTSSAWRRKIFNADRMKGAEPGHALDHPPTIVPTRSSISRAALLVKVTLRIRWPRPPGREDARCA
jgi:hypothetical protein